MSTPDPVINVAALEARLKAVETAVVAKEHAVVAWIKTNFPHFVTWVGGAYALIKAGLVHL